MGDYYTEIFGKAPKAGTVIPGEGTVLKEVVITPKRPRKYRFDRRVSTIGPGHDVISETLYDEYSDGQYMGDLSGVAGQRTIYVTPFGNDTIYGRTRNWQGGEPNRLLETNSGFMEVAPDRKDQTRRKRQFQTNLKSSHVSPNSSKDEKNAYKRAIKEKQKGGDLSKPRLISKQQNKQFKPKFISKDQAAKDSIEANVYNNQTVQDTKPGNYVQKNGKTVWVPDRTKAPYKKQEGGSLKGVSFYQNGSSLIQKLDSKLRKNILQSAEDATLENELRFAREQGIPHPMMNSEEYNKLDRYMINGIEKKLEELQNEADKKRFNVENIRKNYPWIGKDLNPSFSNGTVLY